MSLHEEHLHKLNQWIEEGREFDIIELFSALHPADIADLIESLSEEDQNRLFTLLAMEKASDVIMELSDASREQILGRISDERLARIVGDLDSDEAADILADLPDKTVQEVLKAIPKEDSDDVRKLLAYDEESAGGLMQTEIARIFDHDTVSEAIERIRRLSPDVKQIHYAYVTNRKGILVGVVPLWKLIQSQAHQPIALIMEKEPIAVKAHVDQEEVAQIFQKYNLLALPVVDENGLLLGRITIDDVMDVVVDEASEDFLRMAGTSENELVYSSRIFRIARYRLPWLVINLFGGLLTGYLMWLFKWTLKETLVLVTFIPVITGMGGNAGTQSSSIMVRGLATEQVRLQRIRFNILKEFRVGIIMGLACGGVVGCVAYFWHGSPMIGVVVAIAMTTAITVACTMGTLVPAIFYRLKIDPAVSSGPFVTTANDITGIIIYLGIATLAMKFLH
ncbi:MAG: magnesium transporter [Deltaproteobacteria bacterium]|nr:magnesium transporter [Deltaproteobacteria bacterium]